ncbi:hypothetical protein G9A89_004355 [Geosiphon pyriformis]|nr:hypothetical protein G9A89_004355 [Geosiphon pyriformis]
MVIQDEIVLNELSSTATFAWEASCQQIYETNKVNLLHGVSVKRVWAIFSDATISFGAIEYPFDQMANPKRFFWDSTPYPYAEHANVCKIFYERWEKYSSKFWKKLVNLEKENNNYTFTGFGIGAVFAVFAALEYKRNNMEASITLITFGQPRIGDDLFVIYTQRILDKAWRVTYRDDWLPNFPIEGFNREMASPLRNGNPKVVYRHFQKEFWIEPRCDCSNHEEVYLCYHMASLHENEVFLEIFIGDGVDEAIESYKVSHPVNEHLGPYFGHTMSQNCPEFKTS